MKKLFLLLLFCPLFSMAQDWHGVRAGQHNIYKVNIQGVDSFWNNYLRDIYVDNIIIGFNGTTFNFYRSLRMDENEILDTLTGPTWLGRAVFRDLNGDENFQNKYLDTVRIKTLATINQSWTLGQDTIGTKTFVATVTSVDTMTIDGTVDSIKIIDIQAFVGNTAVASVYNNYQIVLSKAHGFMEIFDIYGFPEYENSPPFTSNPNVVELFPTLPYPHHRLDSTILDIDFKVNDLNYQYQPGNYWMTEGRQSGIAYPSYSFDSIISVTPFTQNAIIISVLRESLTWKYVQANPSFISTFTSNIVTDTIYNQTAQQLKLVNYPDCEIIQSIPTYNSSPYRFLDSFCHGRFALRDTSTFLTPISGNKFESHSYYNGLDIDIRRYITQGQANSMSFSGQFVFYNFNGCQFGSYFSLRPTAVDDFYNQHNLFKIYPNPTTDNFYMETNVAWNAIEVISIQGQILRTYKPNQVNHLSLTGLPIGIYIVKVKTDKGNYLQKIMKD